MTMRSVGVPPAILYSQNLPSSMYNKVAQSANRGNFAGLPILAGQPMSSYQIAAFAEGAESHTGTLRNTIAESLPVMQAQFWFGGLR